MTNEGNPASIGKQEAHLQRDSSAEELALLTKQLNRRQRQGLVELQQAWQRLALHILRDSSLQPPSVLGITSTIRGEGRTTTAIGLTYAFSRETMKPVVLLEADIERPTIAADLGLDPRPGLLDYLNGKCGIEAAFRATTDDSLALMVSGAREPDWLSPTKAQDLSVQLRHRIPDILTRLKQSFSYVVVDLPPLSSHLQTEGVARLFDGNLLVVRSGVTSLPQVQESVQLLSGRKFVGIVHVSQPSSVPHWLSRLVLG